MSPAAATWSPDGRSLAVADEADGHLYLVDVDTGTATRLTDSETDDTQPRWSPDGSEIAYVAFPNP